LILSSKKLKNINIYKKNITNCNIEIFGKWINEKMMCPENEYRKTIAYYYVSPLISLVDTNYKIGVNSTGYRTKATFVKRPEDKYDGKLYKIRPNRRIIQKDMDEIYPEWNINSLI